MSLWPGFRKRDLRGRLLGSVVSLALTLAFAAMLAMGLSLRGIAVSSLRNNAEREASGLAATLAPHARAGDHAAINRLLRQRILQPHLARVHFQSGDWVLDYRHPPRDEVWPDWFGRLVALPRSTASAAPDGDPAYGRLSVELDHGFALHSLWDLLLRFIALFALGVAGFWLALRRLLRINLAGLGELRRAAWSVEAGDFSARARETANAPAELTEASRAFNRMAETVERLVAALAREQDATLKDRERMRVTIASIGDGVIVTDADGVVESINPRACEIAGLVPADAIGRRAADVLPLIDDGIRYELWLT